MYKIGDKIVHQREGACHITQTVSMDMGQEAKQYFVLEPILDCKTNVYVSTDSKKQHNIRPVIPFSELTESETHLEDIDSEWIENPKERYQTYSKSLSGFHFRDTLQVLKCLIIQNQKKILASKDKELLSAAEKLVCSEMAILHNLSFETAVQNLHSRILNG